MKTLWYFFFKIIIKSSLFFYTKKVEVIGKEHIPSKGAVLFVVNHPNGLIDPLIVAVNNPRIQHFLVRAAVFKKPLVKKFLSTLNLMPIYRIRDGIEQLGKNQKIFEQCFSILNSQKALMIFPEGSHDKRRTIRPISKGFSRIVFGALERNPKLKIQIIPVGITYASFAGLCIIATTIVGMYKFNQMPDIYTLIGLLLIISGVLIVNLLGKTG